MFDVVFEVDVVEGVFEFFDSFFFGLKSLQKNLFELILLIVLLVDEIS